MAHVALLLADLLKRAKEEKLDWVVEALTELYKQTYKAGYRDGKEDAHVKEWQGED